MLGSVFSPGSIWRPSSGPLQGATIDMQFTSGRYYGADEGDLTVTRATPTTAYAETVAGAWTGFAANVLRRTDKGVLIEDARTNVVLHNRDLTNVAWTPTNITAAKDQVGIDGVANAASSLTATAGNGTILQAITLASSARFQSAFVKRITGTGTIEMTMDNGATWTGITVTSSYTQLSIPTQTLANPTVGFRIVTSGDAIAVDFVQNENGTSKTSPIPVTTVAVARATDVVSFTSVSQFGLVSNSIFVEWQEIDASLAATSNLFSIRAGDNDYQRIGRTSAELALGQVISGGVNSAVLTATNAVVAGGTYKGAMRMALDDYAAAFTPALQAAILTDVSGALPVGAVATVHIGSLNGIQASNAFIRRLAYFSTPLSNDQLLAITS
jgi:hypothetical protein